MPALPSLISCTSGAILAALGMKTSAAPGAPPASFPTPAAAAGHRELRLAQCPPAIGGDDRVEPATDLWQNAYARLLQSKLQPLRDRPANQHLYAQLAQAADDPVRLLLKQHDVFALQLGFAFQANQHQPRRHVEDRRHATLTIGNRNQHAWCNARFVPTVNPRPNRPEPPPKPSSPRDGSCSRECDQRCKAPLSAAASHRILRHCPQVLGASGGAASCPSPRREC